ncbi:hypothetical protein V8U06_28845, partial [Shinella sp. G-2]
PRNQIKKAPGAQMRGGFLHSGPKTQIPPMQRYFIYGRWPTGMEAAGVAVLIAGVVLAIRVFHSQRPRSKEVLAQIS